MKGFRSRLDLLWVFLFLLPGFLSAREVGEDIYLQRCFWCHGEKGDGNGPSAVGMFPRPRNFVRADYKIRSTPNDQLPTGEDLFRSIANGLPGTPMPAWRGILSEDEIRAVVKYIKNFSSRFQKEKPELIPAPQGAASVKAGEEVFRKARCYMCHGLSGRGDGAITATLNFEWGIPPSARDFTRGWTFKGGHEPGDIYLRITGGLKGTAMGPYQDLLSDQERWDLAHYVAALDREPVMTGGEFLITANLVEGEIPFSYDALEWRNHSSVLVPLGGQVVRDPPLRWWIPTVGSMEVKALWNGREIGFLLEWDDPTGPQNPYPDSALLQFASREQGKPYFLFGDEENPVRIWSWRTDDQTEEWEAGGIEKTEAFPPRFEARGIWEKGRWHVLFRKDLGNAPDFSPGRFVPILFSIYDGANAEINNVRALSTWFYATLEKPASLHPWLLALASFLAAVIGEVLLLRKLKK